MDYGPSEFDHTHRFVVSYVWDLPKLANRSSWLRYSVGGWRWSGIVASQSRGPFTVLAGKDQSLTGLGIDRAQLCRLDLVSRIHSFTSLWLNRSGRRGSKRRA